MTTTRKQYSAKFKARVAVEAIRGEKTLNQLGSQFGVWWGERGQPGCRRDGEFPCIDELD